MVCKLLGLEAQKLGVQIILGSGGTKNWSAKNVVSSRNESEIKESEAVGKQTKYFRVGMML